MSSKEKAKELVYKYSDIWSIDLEEAKYCAMICVNEIINLMIKILVWDKETNGNIHYWEEVKEEIKKL